MSKFRKKPVVIDAFLNTGNPNEIPEWFPYNEQHIRDELGRIHIGTLEGTMCADVGDWIIKGVNGEFYPCKPDIFEKTYEAVEDVQ